MVDCSINEGVDTLDFESNLHDKLSDDVVLFKIEKINNYIQSFQYNYMGIPFFSLKKTSNTVAYIYEQAKFIIKSKLPIQCVEALFIGAYLTSAFVHIPRVPVSFKTKLRGTHRHIVLFLKCNSFWGSIGISRRSSLMNKPFMYPLLEDLLKEFQLCYSEIGHRLQTIYLGSPIPHSQSGTVNWRSEKIRINGDSYINNRQISNFVTVNNL